jgi:hypothetical protein
MSNATYGGYHHTCAQILGKVINMTRGDLPGVKIFGRAFKPFAVGLIIGGFTLSVNTLLLFFGNHLAIPIPGDDNIGSRTLETAPSTIAALVMGLFAGLGTLLMVYAWIIRSQRIYEYGLLLSFGAWTARWIGIALDGEPWYAMLPFAVSFMAAGAYWLERADERDEMR